MSSVEATSSSFSQTKTNPPFSALERKYLFASLFLILVSSTVFGFWFKIKQLAIASPEIIPFYPAMGYAVSVLQTVFFFSVLWLGLTFTCIYTSQSKNNVAPDLFSSALPFSAFLLSACDIKLSIQFQLFLFFSVFLLLLKLYKNRALLNGPAKEPICVFILYFLVFLFLFRSYSPFYGANFIESPGRLDSVLPLERQWENAKAYDFLGYFSQFIMLGGYSQAQYLLSELSSLIVLLLDIPLVDLLSKYDTLTYMFFGLYIFGSFGCYCLLRFGLKLLLLPSFIGGLGYILGNTSYLLSLSYEYANHTNNFIIFVWMLFFLKRAHDLDKPVLACFAGLFGSLIQYAMSTSPETEVLGGFFANIYNIYLSFVRLRQDRFESKAIARFFKNIAIFPVFHFIGLSYRLGPLFYSLAIKEFAIFDLGITDKFGFFWPGDRAQIFYFFFGVDDNTLMSLSKWLLASGGGLLLVPYYTGQFMVFLIFSLICCYAGQAYRRIVKKKKKQILNHRLKRYAFFFFMFLFMASNVPFGDASLLHKLMAATKFFRIHSSFKLTMFYSFFALVAAMCSLDYILRSRRLFHLNTVFLLYLLTLMLVYFAFSPFTGSTPSPILGAGVLFATWFLLFQARKSRGTFQNENKRCQSYHNALSVMLVVVALFSFVAITQLGFKSITENPKKITGGREKIFTSFRSAISMLRNNPHDEASYNYLDQKLEKFLDAIEDKMESRNISPENHNKIKNIFEQYTVANQQLMEQKQESEKNQTSQALKGLFGGRDRVFNEKVLQKNNKLALYEHIAPEIDKFNLAGDMRYYIEASSIDWGPLPFDSHNSFQFYLPDKYQLYGFYTDIEFEQGRLFPVGKNSEVMGQGLYAVGGAYPSIDVNFYLKGIHPSLKKLGSTDDVLDYTFRQLTFDSLMTENHKKLINIIGMDYISFPNYAFNRLPSSSATWQSLLSMGFIPVEGESHFAPRFGGPSDPYRINFFQNTRSYGKAYIAKWVRTIEPGENMFNRRVVDLPRHWPVSDELVKNFENNIARIPDNIWRSAIIELTGSGVYPENPRIYESNNDVNVVKIIGSKAVFDVNCEDDHCWFVYNTAALKGWRAFSGSTSLPIHKANLGFIGLQLNKGKHFVWMEYRPVERDISFIAMTLAWIIVLSILIFRFPHGRTKQTHEK